MRTRTGCRLFSPLARRTLLFGSLAPLALNPLDRLRARTSQNIQRLLAALITVGVLRGSARRVLTPLRLKHRVGEGHSAIFAGTGFDAEEAA